MKNRRGYIVLLMCLGWMAFTNSASGQFYNGLHMNFGKNRIQYPRSDILESEFYSSFYRFDRFDVYFYPNGQELAEYLSKRALTELARMESFFEYSLNKRVIFLVFNRLTDYRQSNLGLVSGREETNIGGVTKILDNKVFLYFEGDYRKFDQQITAAVTEVILQEMLYGGSMRDQVTSSALLNLPEWYYKGLISFLSKGWDVETDDRVRDGIINKRFAKFNQLNGEDAIHAGHSIWNFVSETFGRSVIPPILYFARVNRNVSSGFTNVLGMSLNALTYEWLHFYQSRYSQPPYQGDLPEYGAIRIKNRKDLHYFRPRISPDGRYITYVSNRSGRIKVHLHDDQTGKSTVINRTGAKLGQIEDYTFPVVNWHPTGELLAMATEHKGTIRFSIFPVETRKWEHDTWDTFQKVLDFDYSDDGLNIVLSAVIKGQSDLFIRNLLSRTNRRITNDRADDLQPRFTGASREILFSSNRTSLSLTEQKENDLTSASYDLFIYSLAEEGDQLVKIAEDPYADRIQPERLTDRRFVYLGDDNGIRNRFVATYDSTILAIDTTVHYTWFTRSTPLTRYQTNIIDQDVVASTGTYTELFRFNNKYRIHRDLLPAQSGVKELAPTSARLRINREQARRDSLNAILNRPVEAVVEQARRVLQLGADSAADPRMVNINQYLFEDEKVLSANRMLAGESWLSRLRDPLGRRTTEFPQIRIYQPAFYVNYLASQVDFNFLNASYQPFTGGAVYYNPGFNMMFKVGTQDLFEDYKLTAGVRFGGNFDSNEYLLSFENLKYRVDHEAVFHRMVYVTQTLNGRSLVKSSTQEFFYVARYPFSQVSSVRATLTARADEYTFLSTDQGNLKLPGLTKLWGGLKMEYVFDNTMSTGLNLYDGTRMKIWGEYFKQANGNFSNVFVVGGDVRHYQPLHRTLIWANRLAASTSFGSGRLIYYLGAVDNWTNLSRNVETFDYSVPIDTTQFFVYQALATNMRGFTQNIRNGNSFAVFNSEIRWPIFRYFANRPINSDFLNNFQVIGFFDVGTAWSGPSPWDERNHFNLEIIEKGPIKVVIHKGNQPVVAGFGFGLRSRLLGYFVRLDWSWGIDNYVLLPRLFYLSLSLDF